MSFLDRAWATSFEIAQKNPSEMKVLVPSNLHQPLLSRDDNGYVLHIPHPRMLDDGSLELHGMSFKRNDKELSSLWRLFNASVYHLSGHAAISDLRSYNHWPKGKDVNLAVFSISLIEDHILRAHMKVMWRGLLPDIAHANYLSYLRLKPICSIRENSLKAQSALLSHLATGGTKGQLPSYLEEPIGNAQKSLEDLESIVKLQLQSQVKDTKEHPQDKIASAKIEVAERLYRILERYGSPREVCSLPYTESHGTCSIFGGTTPSVSPDGQEALEGAYRVLSITPSDIELAESQIRYIEESLGVISAFESSEQHKKKILSNFATLCKGTHFHSLAFPFEDYAEYLRTRIHLMGSIRRISDELRLLTYRLEETAGQPEGVLDLQTAIQVVASRSMRRDVFIKEETLARDEAWCILVDSSKSLKQFSGEVAAVTICLAEVAKDLMASPNSWGLFAFSDRLQIVKDFSEGYNQFTRARIGGLKQGGLTFLPDAILTMAKAIKAFSFEERKYVLVVSDGVPLGYANIQGELEDAMRTVHGMGITFVGIGVSNKNIRNYFKVNCVVNTPYDLMRNFVRTYTDLANQQN